MCDDAERLATIPLPRVQELLAQARAQAAAEEREACARVARMRLDDVIDADPAALRVAQELIAGHILARGVVGQ